MIVPNPDDLPPMTQQEALRIMQAVTRRPQTHYEGYRAGLDDGADIGPSGALTWASIVGASIIIGLVILWILSHNF